MSNPIILSDGEDEEKRTTPLPSKKKPRTNPIPTVFLLDDDPTPPPKKPAPVTGTASPSSSSSIPSFVADTPMSDAPLLKSTSIRVPIPPPGGNGGLICLDSESESESRLQNFKEHSKVGDDEEVEYSGWSPRLFSSYDSFGDANLTQTSGDTSSQPTFLQDDIYQVSQCSDKENFSLEQMGNIAKKKVDISYNKKNSSDEAVTKKRMIKEERIRLAEEKKLKKEQEKLEKAALRAQAAELKKMEKEKQKWEKGKFALKSIVAEFDTKVVEQGSVGGHLLSRFADKGLTYRITKNPIERSITWTMSVPEHISELSSGGTEVRYVVLVFDAEEFCNLVINGLLLDHVSKVQNHYPSYTVCYLTNRLLAYINKR
ncbi:hypothetical protein Tsubulata_013570 [Turnera subulata]|uniref:ERCC4 domain-containing protein n=1 Tax=Turnera subulata TaxID=218843 RepID=A0A9Q0F089_9ROSI|nr:hypothetical protein Tsubulata_013570 [Turnera subulata]